MFRPTGFDDLRGRRVGVLGYGVEGHASVARLAGTCELVVVDDDPSAGPDVLAVAAGGREALASCDVILKSPGVSAYSPLVHELRDRGVYVTSALNLWLRDDVRNRVVAVTGTKGKSTTTTLVEFFLHCCGERAQRLGNIGRPPYDPGVVVDDGWLVLEVSSFQSVDLEVAPGVVIVTSLGVDHLDWHGSVERYHADKLTLTRATGAHVSFVNDAPALRDARDLIGGDVVYVAPEARGLTGELGLLGAHNDGNVALALAAVAHVTARSLDDIVARVRARRHEYQPLPGRLSLLADVSRGPRRYRFVDDGLATSPLPVAAALDVFADEPLSLLCGGFDRGVDYHELADRLRQRRAPTSLVALGPAGRRICELVAPTLTSAIADTMDEAVALGVTQLIEGGVLLFSPGAPSFDRYRNWEERSSDFARVVREVTRQWSLGRESNP